MAKNNRKRSKMKTKKKPGPKRAPRDQVATEHIAVTNEIKKFLKGFGGTYNAAITKLRKRAENSNL